MASISFDESKYARDAHGRFTFKSHSDSQADLKSTGVGGNDTIVDTGGNPELDGMSVQAFIEQHPGGPQAAVVELAAGHKAGVIGFRSTEGETRIDEAGRQAINDYTAVDYRPMNMQLRGLRPMTPEMQVKVDELDRVLNSASLPEATTVHRGVGSLGVKVYSEQGLGKGSIFTEAGFMSTSADAGVARDFAQVSRNNMVMEIRAPKGAKALNISRFSDNPGEREVLFARGTRMKVVSFSKSRNLLVVEVLND